MTSTLYQLTAQMAEIECILSENGGELTPELEAAWDETREGLMSKADNYNALIQKFKASEAAIDNEIKRLQSLQKTVKNGQKRLKDHILECMNAFDIKQLEGQFCKMSVRSSKSLNVEDEMILFPFRGKIDELNALLPDYVTVDVNISKTAIKEQFKDTDVLPAGCEYVENETLQIR
jgi:hypothetical protein